VDPLALAKAVHVRSNRFQSFGVQSAHAHMNSPARESAHARRPSLALRLGRRPTSMSSARAAWLEKAVEAGEVWFKKSAFKGESAPRETLMCRVKGRKLWQTCVEHP